jgi:hypothetical protein
MFALDQLSNRITGNTSVWTRLRTTGHVLGVA